MRAAGIGSAAVTLALALPAAAVAAPAVDKVTGGGQTLVSTKGAGNTIAFTAQNLAPGDEAARGQAQYNERSTGFKVHGVVDCLAVMRGTEEDDPDMAVVGGTYRKDASRRFRIYVVDNGQGSMAENDMIMFERVASDDERGPCEPEDDSFDDLPELGRGNVKIHKAPSGDAAPSQQQSQPASGLPALTAPAALPLP